MSIIEVWDSISEKQAANLPLGFQKLVRDNLKALPKNIVTNRLISSFREIEFGYREPDVQPELHCASTGALLSLICSLEGVSSYHLYWFFQQLEKFNLHHPYLARVLVLHFQSNLLTAIAQLLSSRNEAAIRVMARTLIEASEYLLVIPRDPNLARSYIEDKNQFKQIWSKSLRPAKVRSKRATAVRSCSLFGKQVANDLNKYFDDGHSFLSMSTHPSGFSALAAMYSSFPESELPTKNLKSKYLLATSVRYTLLPFIAAILSDIAYFCEDAKDHDSTFNSDVILSYQSEIVSIFKAISPILNPDKRGAPSEG